MAIKYIHFKKILHRDIKCQNVFLDENLDVKLGDFGISKILENTMDYAKTYLGTPYFLSPEICANEKYNYKSDIWMLGCVLFELCTLKKPFYGDTLIGLMRNIIEKPIPDIPSHYSKEIKQVKEFLLQKDPNKRPFIGEVLDLEIVVAKMEQLNIKEFESPEFHSRRSNSSRKNTDELGNFNLKKDQSGVSKEIIEFTQEGSHKTFTNSLNSNTSNGIQFTQSSGEVKNKFRKRTHDKINKKYPISMGHIEFGDIMSKLDINPSES